MDTLNLFTGVLSAIGGGGIGAYLTYKNNKRLQDSSDFELVVQKYKDLNDSLELRLEKLEAKMDEMVEREMHLQRKIAALQAKLQFYTNDLS